MTFLTALAYYRTAIFYYLLGGLTFLPLCALAVAVHFWLTAPPYRGSDIHGAKGGAAPSLGEIIGEGELSEERQRQALDLASWNRDAEKEAEEAKSKDDDGGSTSIPAAARRVKPPPPAPRRPHRAGWLTVRRHFQLEGVNLALQQAAQQAALQAAKRASTASVGQSDTAADDGKGQGYMSTLYRGMLNYRSKNNPDAKRKLAVPTSDSRSTTPDNGAEDATSAPGSPQIAAATSAQVSAAKETFYCILKGPILYLYSSADPSNPDTECHAAIDLRNKRVSIFVAGEGDTMGEPDDVSSAETTHNASVDSSAVSEMDGTANGHQMRRRQGAKARKARVRDGELFVKRNAVRIVSMGSSKASKDSIRFAQWFIFAKNASQLEDWYHALLYATMLPEGSSEEGPDVIGPVFSTDDMSNLLTSLDSVPDPIPLRWLNAMVGRIFFSIYRTAWIEDYITHKFSKKISRVRTPGFLSDIRVREVNLGNTPPAFSRPMLKSLTGDGEASMEVAIHYAGSLRLTISTVLTISLGQRFKQYNVSLVLAVIINSLEGNLLLHIKPPPSNRLWFGFTKLPKMDISVEPVVSERKVQWSMVKRLIEGRIRELLTESLVLPNMDDIPFFDTRSLEHRGGIWADAAKPTQRIDVQTTAQPGPPLADQNDASAQSKSTPASVLNMSVGDEQATSSSVDANNGIDSQVRNRRMGGESSNSDPALVASSPAAAGLSSLLARDQAASGSSGPTAGPNKRRSWFVGKNNPNKGPPASQKSAQPHSSLAWGSASLSSNAGSRLGDGLSHERNKTSIGSMSSFEADGTDASADVDHTDGEDQDIETAEVDVGNDADLQGLDSGDVHPNLPALNVESVDAANEQDKVLAKNAGISSTHDGDDTVADARTPTREFVPAVPPRPSAKSPANSFAPPPHRSARPSPSLSASIEQRRDSPAAQSLASLQRDRYSARPADDTPARAGTTSAALLTSWNKAKASMADKDSRQAAAKEAKDALKRGWANWNSKRTGQVGVADEGRANTIMTSSDRIGGSSSRPDDAWSVQRSTRSRTSSWLASSPEDPASLGAGFDAPELMSSPSVLSLDARHGDEGDDASSRTSSVSGRKPYREHRADRLRREDEAISRSTSRASSIHSMERASTPPHASQTAGLPSIGTWDAAAPGLTAPMPAAHREQKQEAQLQSALSSSPSSIRRTMQSSAAPSAATMGGAAPGSPGNGKPSYSFLPNQPTATTGLSGVDLPMLPSQDTAAAGPRLGMLGEIHRGEAGSSSQARPSASPATSPIMPQERLTFEVITSADLPPDLASSNQANPQTTPIGIKQQPTRAPMMAVPGIPSMQKASPQSFEAPAPAQSPKSKAGTLYASSDAANSPRLGLGNLIARMPSFAAASGPTSTAGIPAASSAAGQPIAADNVAESPSTTLQSTEALTNEPSDQGPGEDSKDAYPASVDYKTRPVPAPPTSKGMPSVSGEVSGEEAHTTVHHDDISAADGLGLSLAGNHGSARNGPPLVTTQPTETVDPAYPNDNDLSKTDEVKETFNELVSHSTRDEESVQARADDGQALFKTPTADGAGEMDDVKQANQNHTSATTSPVTRKEAEEDKEG